MPYRRRGSRQLPAMRKSCLYVLPCMHEQLTPLRLRHISLSLHRILQLPTMLRTLRRRPAFQSLTLQNSEKDDGEVLLADRDSFQDNLTLNDKPRPNGRH